MMTLHIRTRDHKETRLELPTPPDELRRQTEAVFNAGETLCVSHIDSPIPGLQRHFRDMAFTNESTLRKLNRLAKMMDNMSLTKRFHLEKALYMSLPQGLDTVIQTAAHVKAAAPDCYEILPGVTTAGELGEWRLKQECKDETTAKRLRPHLNLESLGRTYLFEHKGAFLPEGYVGLQAGLEPFDVIQLTLSSDSNSGVCLSLPASSEALEQAGRELEVEDISQAAVSGIRFSVFYSYLEELLPLDGITAEDANCLAECLGGPEAVDPIKFRAALAAARPAAFSEALTIAQGLEYYTFVPQDPAEYARDKLRLAGVDGETFDILEGYTDFERMGEDVMRAEGVRQTEFGLIRRISAPFPEEADQSFQIGGPM